MTEIKITEQLTTLCTDIESKLLKLRNENNYDLYDQLEFDLLQLNVWLSEYEYDYEKIKLENSIKWSIEFNRERLNNKSDVSTERVVQETLREKLFTEKIQKNTNEKYNKLQKWYIRIADHIKSRFIKNMADEKRQRMVENIQD